MNCRQCGEELVDKREDAIYCNHNCQQKYFKRKKRILNRIQKLERDKKSNEEYIEKVRIDKEEKREREKARKEKLSKFAEKLRRRITALETFLKLKGSAFRVELLRYLELKERNPQFNLAILKNGSRVEQLDLMREFQGIFNNMLVDARKQSKKISLELVTLGFPFTPLFEEESKEDRIVRKLKSELEQFDEELEDLRGIDLDRLPIKPSRKAKLNRPKRVSPSKAYSGKEILNMKFDGVELKGCLGKFLGKLQREKCAIALTGDSGAGKSTFSFQLAKGFINKGLSVAYFSLESGITESTQESISRFDLEDSLFRTFEEGGLKDVRTEAENFDCVIIDSYAKISGKAVDFEELRQDFPNTYFVIIFQKTTDGKIRGGSSILFNSTATIDIVVSNQGERLAVMKKSRYGRENYIYSITRDTLVKQDKNPISWKDIENFE